MRKKICFCCVTVFHVFLSCLFKKAYFAQDDASIELCLTTEKFGHEINKKELGCLFSMESEANRHYDEVYVFTRNKGSLINYASFGKAAKKILVYEGITSFQLTNWLTDVGVLHQLELFDEIWTPDERMMLDREYAHRLKNFSFREYLRREGDLKECCEILNRIFDYSHQQLDFDILFFDRYLSTFNTIRKNDENLLLSMILEMFGTERFLIKKHPFDRLDKYESCQERVLEQPVPWELIYLNRLIHKEIRDDEVCLLYNSSAPMNNALLFGQNNFSIICIDDFLGKYANIDKTYLDAQITKQIFQRFSDLYGVSVNFLRGFADLRGQDERALLTDDAAWNAAEESLVAQGAASIFELRGFRLRMDALLYRLGKTTGSYRCMGENLSAKHTRELMAAVLPSFRQDEISPDFEILCGIHAKPTLEKFLYGVDVLMADEESFAAKLRGADALYVWGTTQTTIPTFEVLRKAGLSEKLKCVLHSRSTGFHQGFPVKQFKKSLIEPNSMIIVCAGEAYGEIGAILNAAGFSETTDYVKGVGL